MRIVVELPWQSGLSSNIYRFGAPSPKAKGRWKKARVRKPEVQQWMEDAGWLLLKVIAEARVIDDAWGIHIQRPVRVEVDFRWPDARRRDADNYFKVICDSIKGPLGLDDKDILPSARSAAIDRGRPGFTVTIRDAGEV
jgi:Holliday junction resolvase RusA-like endonuclease